MGRPPKKQFDKLLPRQKKFVMEVLQPGNTVKDAVAAAGYSTHPQTLHTQGAALMSNPKIQRAISEIIEDVYPDAAQESIAVLQGIIRDSLSSNTDKMNAIKMLGMFKGWNAPTKHDSRKLVVNVDKYKLPEGG